MGSSKAVLAAAVALAACGGGGGGGSPGTGGQTCAEYCSRLTSTCVLGDVQYGGPIGSCESYCAMQRWPAGLPGATSGNSLACRITHIGLAEASGGAEHSLHCAHAGPTGGNQCGSWCDNYCSLALQNCTGANGAGLGFTDLPSCLAACASFPSGGAVNAASGNHVQCRIFHAGAAASTPSPHCGNAQVVSSATVGGTTADGPCN